MLRALDGLIEREVEAGLVPDLVVITGTSPLPEGPEEYALAGDWLENQLWRVLGDLPRNRLLLVPGNHDVDRGRVGRRRPLDARRAA